MNDCKKKTWKKSKLNNEYLDYKILHCGICNIVGLNNSIKEVKSEILGEQVY